MSTHGASKDVIEVPVSGTELALLLAATHMVDGWSFERRTAARMITRTERTRVGEIGDQLFLQSKRILESIGAFSSPVSPWTRDFIAKRASAQGELRITPEQVHLVVLALRACHEEFSSTWGEFCVASPGNIEWYGVKPDDLLTLADKLDHLFLEHRA